MVSGKTVNVLHVLPEGLLVCLCAQHGTHLAPPTTNTIQVLVTQEEMVRTNLASHLHALILSSTNDKYLVRVVR